MAKPHTPMSRIRVLLIAVSAILAAAACQGAPTETTTTSVHTASATAHVDRA